MPNITPDQNKIIDAAFRLFAANGHEKTTMAQIAKDLGYSRTFLYYYFPDKESIYKNALLRSANFYLDSLKQQLKKDISGMKMLENSMKTKVLCAQNFQILGVYTNQAIYKIYAEDKDLSFIMANEKKLLKKIVECGKKDGSVINCNAAKIVDQLIDGLIGYMSLSLRKMGPDHALTEPEMKALRKGQLEFGALLLKALSTK